MRRRVRSMVIGGAAAVALVFGSVTGAAASPGTGEIEDGGSAAVSQTAPAAPIDVARPDAAVATKKAKKHASAATVAKRAHRAGKKASGWSKTTSMKGFVRVYKASKSQKWWVSPGNKGGKAYKMGGSPAQSEVTKYRKAVASELKRSGLKARTVSKMGNQRYQAYSSSRVACTVSYSVKTNDSYAFNVGAGVACTSVKRVKQAVKKTRLFANAQRAAGVKVKHVSFSVPRVKKSASKTYRKYQKAWGMVWWVGAPHGDVGAYAKAPGKKWRAARDIAYGAAIGGHGACSSFEKSRVVSRAWAGHRCVRGEYPNTTQSRVRAQ